MVKTYLSAPKIVHNIYYGLHVIPAWYWSPFAKEYENHELHFCDFCLSYFTTGECLQAHLNLCELRHPPGNEIYRDTTNSITFSVFEVDGAVEETYCQNLGLFARMFLEHKFLKFDTKPFLYYVFCELHDDGFRMVSYFSREKFSEYNYNLACILTVPCYQRKGYGNLMINFSYQMSAREKKVGTPEVPISELGLIAYRKMWALMIYNALKETGGNNELLESTTISEISKRTWIKTQDIIDTMKFRGWLRIYNNEMFIQIGEDEKEKLKKYGDAQYKIKTEKFHWMPLV